MVPAPAPNATSAALSVPGAAGAPGPAPMFSVPIEGKVSAITTGALLLTVPPFAIVSVPVPDWPTSRVAVFKVEPAPVTIIVPCTPKVSSTEVLPVVPPTVSVPPFSIVTIPGPNWPTIRWPAAAPGVCGPITAPIPSGAVVEIAADEELLGRKGAQLLALSQSEVVPTQPCAWVDEVAASNAAATAG